MLDDLRNSASKSFQEEEEAHSPKAREVIRIQPLAPREPFLGMTASQRFVIALLIFLMVSVLGALLLVAGGKVFIL